MKKTKPFFTVIIPVYNAENSIEKALNSVIKQTYKNFEIILVDDASTDNSFQIITKYLIYENIYVHRNTQNKGVTESRYTALNIAKGDYIAFLDSDDTWHVDKLLKQKERINATNCDICYTAYECIYTEKQKRKKYNVPETVTYTELLKENVIGCSSVIVRTETLKTSGFCSLFYHEDYALWLLLLKNGATICGIQDILMYYHISRLSRSYNKVNAAIHRYFIYRRQEKMNVFKSLYFFLHYTLNGIKKHFL